MENDESQNGQYSIVQSNKAQSQSSHGEGHRKRNQSEAKEKVNVIELSAWIEAQYGGQPTRDDSSAMRPRCCAEQHQQKHYPLLNVPFLFLHLAERFRLGRHSTRRRRHNKSYNNEMHFWQVLLDWITNNMKVHFKSSNYLTSWISSVSTTKWKTLSWRWRKRSPG